MVRRGCRIEHVFLEMNGKVPSWEKDM